MCSRARTLKSALFAKFLACLPTVSLLSLIKSALIRDSVSYVYIWETSMLYMAIFSTLFFTLHRILYSKLLNLISSYAQLMQNLLMVSNSCAVSLFREYQLHCAPLGEPVGIHFLKRWKNWQWRAAPEPEKRLPNGNISTSCRSWKTLWSHACMCKVSLLHEILSFKGFWMQNTNVYCFAACEWVSERYIATICGAAAMTVPFDAFSTHRE